VPRDANWSQPSASRQIRRTPGEGHSHWIGTPRIVRVGPSSLMGIWQATANQVRGVKPSLETAGLACQVDAFLQPGTGCLG
jgi:hypothetical protein